jgi:prepilin-type N-terminal cleavage/methylation domain-containing protein
LDFVVKKIKRKILVSWRLGGDGFTLIEIVVAIAIMVMVVGFAGVVFQRSIGSYRTAMAQAEIMRKLRVITEQLDSDFRGLRKDAPMFIWFQQDLADPNKRYDRIEFFADGDFQSVQPYTAGPIAPHLQIPGTSGNPIVGNVARIQYSQARSIDPRTHSMNFPVNLRDYDRLLARRQHILTADPNIYIWPADFTPVNFNPGENDLYEHDTNSISQWQSAMQDQSKCNVVITTCFINGYPNIYTSNSRTLHLLMTEGVGSFSVQWSYQFTSAGQTFIYWWPSIDPDGNGNFSDSDFSATGMNLNTFGFYFNAADPILTGWFSYNGANGSYYPAAAAKPVYPQALKFTFTLYDSRRVFPQGQTFTHIVYLGD